MKLLFDENVSHRLVVVTGAEFPGSRHVREVDLLGASDQRIWEFARLNGFAVVSKDSDFRQRSFVEGPPPKVVWLDVGNDGTPGIATLLMRSRVALLEFGSDEGTALLVLSKTRGAQ